MRRKAFGTSRLASSVRCAAFGIQDRITTLPDRALLVAVLTVLSRSLRDRKCVYHASRPRGSGCPDVAADLD